MLPKNVASTVRGLAESVRPNAHILLLAIAASVVYSVSSLIGLTALVPVVALIAGQDLSELASVPYVGQFMVSMTDDRVLIFYAMIGVILGLSIARAMLAVCTTLIASVARMRILNMWQQRVLDHWMDLSYEHHSRDASSRYLFLTHKEVPEMGGGMKAFVQIVSSLIQISLTLMFLSLVSFHALMGVLLVVAVVMVPLFLVIQRNFNVAAAEAKFSRNYTHAIHEVIKRIDLIDVFGTSAKEKAELSRFTDNYLKASVRMQFYRSLAPFVVQVFMSVILAGLLVYFFHLGASQTTLATVVLFIGGITILHPQVAQISQGLTVLTRMAPAYNAVQSIVAMKRRPADPSITHASPDFSKVAAEIKDLSFAYQTTEGPLPIVQDIDLTLEPGQLIMLFGATGTGKSTFLRLMQGLLTPDKGRICYGGVDLANLNKDHIGRTVLMMQQDGLTFTGTVRENVEYGLESLSENRLMEALRMAAADKFVRQLPDGIDTHIGNDGALLSGGQRQRLTLARIFADSPPIMLLDEPTSSLDRDTEHQVMKSLFELRNRGHTLIMSTHKVELAPLADTVLWFEDHSIVSGRFEDFQHSLTELIPHDKMKSVLTATSGRRQSRAPTQRATQS